MSLPSHLKNRACSVPAASSRHSSTSIGGERGAGGRLAGNDASLGRVKRETGAGKDNDLQRADAHRSRNGRIASRQGRPEDRVDHDIFLSRRKMDLRVEAPNARDPLLLDTVEQGPE